MKYYFFSYYGLSFPIAKKLLDEENDVTVAIVDHITGKKEDPEDKKKRLKCYKGILDVQDADKLMKEMAKIKDKENCIVICDFNNLYAQGEKLISLGFTKGLFPTQKQFELEEDRNAGKEFVKKNYPDLDVAEVHEFKTIDEGIEFLQETENVYVLKGFDDGCATVVPSSDEPEIAREEMISALEVGKAGYEKAGYILEQKIESVTEITPQCVWYNGKPVYYCLDIESKALGNEGLGPLVGCANNLIIKTEEDDSVNEIAFPPAIHEMAKKHPGLFVFDASILIGKDDTLYFGEFCANRFGYDAWFTEIMMAYSVTDYFENLFEGKNPLQYKYGVAVRQLNIKKGEDVAILVGDHEYETFIYDGYMKDDKIVTTGLDFDTLVIATAGDELEEVVEEVFEIAEHVTFTDCFYRTKTDFLNENYNTSVMARYKATEGWLF